MITPKALRLSNELGEEVPVDWDDTEAVERAVTKAIAAGSSSLPHGTIFEVRGKIPPDHPINYDRIQRQSRSRRELAKSWGVAWYWTSGDRHGYYGGMPQRPLFRSPVRQAREASLGGYILIARCKATGTA